MPLYPVLASLWGFLYFYYKPTLWKNNKYNYWTFSVPTAVQSELDTVKGLSVKVLFKMSLENPNREGE